MVVITYRREIVALVDVRCPRRDFLLGKVADSVTKLRRGISGMTETSAIAIRACDCMANVLPLAGPSGQPRLRCRTMNRVAVVGSGLQRMPEGVKDTGRYERTPSGT